jgi:GNAT superfamily N-acetyltransferase
MELRHAVAEDVDAYFDLGRAAQAWLRSRGLRQYVPAAHAEYSDAIRGRVEARTLYSVCDDGDPIGFFTLDAVPSPWWPPDGKPALYLAGMVVSRRARGLGVGAYIINWCSVEAERRGCRAVRLDCHAGNTWLCNYYQSHGFVFCGRVEQHPGYDGCLYELTIAAGAAKPVTVA